MGKRWSKSDERRLKKLFKIKSDEELGKIFGRSEVAIQAKRLRLGLERPKNNCDTLELIKQRQIDAGFLEAK